MHSFHVTIHSRYNYRWTNITWYLLLLLLGLENFNELIYTILQWIIYDSGSSFRSWNTFLINRHRKLQQIHIHYFTMHYLWFSKFIKELKYNYWTNTQSPSARWSFWCLTHHSEYHCIATLYRALHKYNRKNIQAQICLNNLQETSRKSKAQSSTIEAHFCIP